MRVRVLFGMALAAGVLALPATALGAVRISEIQFDSPGNDNGSNTSLNNEWVRIENTGNNPVMLTDWTLRDRSGHVFTFERFRLGAGRTVLVHTGSGNSVRRHLYFDSDEYVWNNDGDTATLRNDNGNRVDRCHYTGAGSSVTC